MAGGTGAAAIAAHVSEPDVEGWADPSSWARRPRRLGTATGVRMCPSSAWPPGASFGQLTGLRHREGVRPLLLRLVAATAVLLAVGGCVSLPADGSPHDPGPASGGRTVAPARPSPLVLPTQGSARERLVDVASARRKAKRPAASRKGHAAPRHAAPGHRAERRPVGRPVPRPARSVASRPRPVPVRAVPRKRHHVAAPRAHRRPPRPRSTIDPGVVCRMAAGRVRGDLLRLCHRTYGR